MFLDRVIPDFDLSSGNLNFSVVTKQYPESTESITKGPYSIANTTSKVDLRARGRQASIRVSCESANTRWRWGSVRLGMQPDGRR